MNPYLGSDGVNPFVKICKEEKKGIFVLVKTSNPSSGEFQDQLVNGRYLENLMEDDLVEESPGLARKFIGVMHQNSQRLMNIIEDMLMISKLESGHSGF